MSDFRGAALVAATITMGLMAGLFYVFSHAIMPGLGRSDDQTFVGGFQAIDKAIVNPWFLLGFLGALVFTALAAVLHVGGDGRPVLPALTSTAAFACLTWALVLHGRTTVAGGA